MAFQTNIYVAQSYSSFYGSGAADLTGADGSGATGGPLPLAALGVGRPIPTFPFVKPLPSVLAGPIPNTLVAEEFTPFDSWAGLTAGDKVSQFRASIARGQAIFNGTAPGSTFVISGVSGLKDGPAGTITNGHCNSCHNVQNTGNDTAAGTQHTGVGDNSTLALPATSDQPLFAFACPVGSIPFFSNPDGLGHDIFITNDPGTGLITGKCKDLGKMKIPVLRGLASRAPYFHGGNAATLDDLVNFYDRRFAIGFTTQQKQDLVNFLNSL
ncbi:MAG: hypothetical protein JOY79_04090 [Acidobacteriaceae bacterium]|nr:hypothetical protein [Acidobacteriaceae bacterium]